MIYSFYDTSFSLGGGGYTDTEIERLIGSLVGVSDLSDSIKISKSNNLETNFKYMLKTGKPLTDLSNSDFIDYMDNFYDSVFLTCEYVRDNYNIIFNILPEACNRIRMVHQTTKYGPDYKDFVTSAYRIAQLIMNCYKENLSEEELEIVYFILSEYISWLPHTEIFFQRRSSDIIEILKRGIGNFLVNIENQSNVASVLYILKIIHTEESLHDEIIYLEGSLKRRIMREKEIGHYRIINNYVEQLPKMGYWIDRDRCNRFSIFCLHYFMDLLRSSSTSLEEKIKTNFFLCIHSIIKNSEGNFTISDFLNFKTLLKLKNEKEEDLVDYFYMMANVYKL